jgi:hypothetical protein
VTGGCRCQRRLDQARLGTDVPRAYRTKSRYSSSGDGTEVVTPHVTSAGKQRHRDALPMKPISFLLIALQSFQCVAVVLDVIDLKSAAGQRSPDHR